MATHGDIGLSQPVSGTITMKLDSITLDQNSTVVHREVMVLGSPETTNALMAVLNAAPASTAWAGVVRIAGGPSSVADLAVRAVLSSTSTDNVVTARSSAADFKASVYQSTVGELRASAYQSTAGDLLATVYQSTVGALRASAYQSTQADLRVTAYQSTQADFKAQVAPISSSGASLCFDSAPASTVQAIAVRPVGGGVDYTHASGALTVSTVTGPAVLLRGTSTTPPAVSTSDTPVWSISDLRGRQIVSLGTVFPAVLNYVASTAGEAGTTAIISSNATLKSRVFALSITCTAVTQNTISFHGSTAVSTLWALRFSSAVMGVNLAVSPPGYLFSNDVGQNLALTVGTTASHAVCVSYFQEP